uniref:Rab9 effector protein with kelch motifs n=1 Tax=Knipowitschia caucasica TaxID=637954 RepID=A0AAV2J281_KNICA
MELLPVLDLLDTPSEGIWYSLIPSGSAPDVSVGHTCTYYSSESKEKGEIIIAGGANPGGSFSHSYVLHLDENVWDIPEWEGLDPRYEHCSFVPASFPHSQWLFGGAQQTGNLQCIQNIQLQDSKPSWKKVPVVGKAPGSRTYHTSSACLGDRLFVFSGGEAGTKPVVDSQLHVFDSVSLTWSQPETHGSPPAARQGHVIVAVGSKVFIHGGMSGEQLFNDIFALDTESMEWDERHIKGDAPPAVAAHSAVALDKHIYVFGGMTAGGASNSMYKFNTEDNLWTEMKFEGDLPANRLDHSISLLSLTLESLEIQ